MGKTKASHEPKTRDKRRALAFSPRDVGGLLKATFREFVEDKCPKQAAALAYYTLFALGPLLLLAIGIAALAFGAEAARGAVLSQFRALLGESGGAGLEELLGGADRERVGLVGTLVGFALLLVSAGAVFAQLKEALNRIWEVEAKRAEGWKAKLVQAVRKNFLSFVGVVGSGFLLLVSLVLSAGLAALGDSMTAAFPGMELLAQLLHFAVSWIVVSVVFAAMFKLLPDARVAWRDVAIGGALTALLFLVGQFALGYYLGSGPLSTSYGAAGAVLVILVWVYYSSMILFFGAELTQVFANRHGSHVRASEDAQTLERATLERQSEPEREGLPDEKPRKAPGRGTA